MTLWGTNSFQISYDVCIGYILTDLVLSTIIAFALYSLLFTLTSLTELWFLDELGSYTCQAFSKYLVNERWTISKFKINFFQFKKQTMSRVVNIKNVILSSSEIALISQQRY